MLPYAGQSESGDLLPKIYCGRHVMAKKEMGKSSHYNLIWLHGDVGSVGSDCHWSRNELGVIQRRVEAAELPVES